MSVIHERLTYLCDFFLFSDSTTDDGGFCKIRPIIKPATESVKSTRKVRMMQQRWITRLTDNRRKVPKNSGLIEAKFIILKMHYAQIGVLLVKWRQELKSYIHWSQLSLNYLLWKFGIDWALFNGLRLKSY